MRWISLLAAALASCSPATAVAEPAKPSAQVEAAPGERGSIIYTGLPPFYRMGDAGVTVFFASDPHSVCAPYAPSVAAEYRIAACTVFNRNGKLLFMVLPNPCTSADLSRFSLTACHELGHVNGWSRKHED